MKKTFIALMALASAAFGADYTIDKAETVWTLNFGTEYGETGYKWTGTEIPTNKGKFWDVIPVEGGTQTSGTKRVHMESGVYGSWDEDFVFTMNLTLGDTISAGNNWPVFGAISGNGTALRFGPYTDQNNTVSMDGSENLTKGTNNIVSVTGGETYTITLTKIGDEVTVAVNGVVSGYGTLTGATGNITDITLGGRTDNQCRINEVVHSISWTKLTVTPAVPEPTTATLSLLALAGLAARRRRK